MEPSFSACYLGGVPLAAVYQGGCFLAATLKIHRGIPLTAVNEEGALAPALIFHNDVRSVIGRVVISTRALFIHIFLPKYISFWHFFPDRDVVFIILWRAVLVINHVEQSVSLVKWQIYQGWMEILDAWDRDSASPFHIFFLLLWAPSLFRDHDLDWLT